VIWSANEKKKKKRNFPPQRGRGKRKRERNREKKEKRKKKEQTGQLTLSKGEPGDRRPAYRACRKGGMSIVLLNYWGKKKGRRVGGGDARRLPAGPGRGRSDFSFPYGRGEKGGFSPKKKGALLLTGTGGKKGERGPYPHRQKAPCPPLEGSAGKKGKRGKANPVSWSDERGARKKELRRSPSLTAEGKKM